MTTDFEISTWGPYFLVHAKTERAREWLLSHWRAPHEPPHSRATKVPRLLAEITHWWDTYEPTYTWSCNTQTLFEIASQERIG